MLSELYTNFPEVTINGSNNSGSSCFVDTIIKMYSMQFNTCSFASKKDSAELQVRGNEDSSKIIFLFLNKNICSDPSIEPSRRNGSNDGS